jgi:hypothetical protein
MPTYDFTGDAITVFGFIGVVSSFIILFTCFRSYFNSPLKKWKNEFFHKLKKLKNLVFSIFHFFKKLKINL